MLEPRLILEYDMGIKGYSHVNTILRELRERKVLAFVSMVDGEKTLFLSGAVDLDEELLNEVRRNEEKIIDYLFRIFPMWI